MLALNRRNTFKVCAALTWWTLVTSLAADIVGATKHGLVRKEGAALIGSGVPALARVLAPSRGLQETPAVCFVTSSCQERGSQHCCGIARYLISALEQIADCRALGAAAYVHWDSSVNALCSDGPGNCFLDYFKAPRSLDALQGANATCSTPVGAWCPGTRRAYHVGQDASLRQVAASIFAEEFVLRDELQRRVDTFVEKHFRGKQVLAVQIRATDYASEFRETLPSVQDWIAATREQFALLPQSRRLFVAADNDEVLQAFIDAFGADLVTFSDAVRLPHHNSPEQEPSQFCNTRLDLVTASERAACRRRAAEGVLLDVWLLARCHTMLFWQGSVAKLALLANPKLQPIAIGRNPAQDFRPPGSVSVFQACSRRFCAETAELYGARAVEV
eukprot:TRINITY_DN58415_c0_g1_i1.p1 TRINITY_DN58415_c0_g1~~TRINITY_DN58415_c0_g1_i1.p1  ORF type:complete len:390 (-),score=64.07 TRINITY_DN58415_c0_g1_i1:1-1170(-)